jgi:hypothetical protein
MKYKKTKIAAGLFLLLAAYVGYELFLNPTTIALKRLYAKPAYMGVDESKPLKDQVRRITMGGRTFDIPIMYVDSQFDDGLEQSGLNFRIILPDFTSIHDFKDRAEYESARKAHRFAYLSIRPSTARASIQKMVQIRIDNEELTKFMGVEHGLEHYIDFDSKKHEGIKWDDTLLEKDKNKKVLSFLGCKPDTDRTDLFPNCNHYFVDKGIYYEINYNKKEHLKDWRKLRTQAIEFLDSFEVKE